MNRNLPLVLVALAVLCAPTLLRLIAVAADDNYPIPTQSYFSIDGYTTPAVSFFDLWGIRLTHN